MGREQGVPWPRAFYSRFSQAWQHPLAHHALGSASSVAFRPVGSYSKVAKPSVALRIRPPRQLSVALRLFVQDQLPVGSPKRGRSAVQGPVRPWRASAASGVAISRAPSPPLCPPAPPPTPSHQAPRPGRPRGPERGPAVGWSPKGHPRSPRGWRPGARRWHSAAGSGRPCAGQGPALVARWARAAGAAPLPRTKPWCTARECFCRRCERRVGGGRHTGSSSAGRS